MVVPTKSQVRKEFGKRFRKLLETKPPKGYPEQKRKRTGWLASTFGVSPEMMRRWLAGIDMPSHTKLIAMAKYLRASPDWLSGGTDDAAPVADDLGKRLIDAFGEIRDSATRLEVVHYAEYRAGIPIAAPFSNDHDNENHGLGSAP